MDDNYSKYKKGGETMKDNEFCNIIEFGSWLWDLISNIKGCNCKK